MTGRLDDCFKRSTFMDFINDAIDHAAIMGEDEIIKTPEDLNRLREAVQTLDGIASRIERRLK